MPYRSVLTGHPRLNGKIKENYRETGPIDIEHIGVKRKDAELLLKANNIPTKVYEC